MCSGVVLRLMHAVRYGLVTADQGRLQKLDDRQLLMPPVVALLMA